MTVLRTLFVTRRYWPHLGDDSSAWLYALADGLQRKGAAPEIVTPRYAASWPKNLRVCDVPIHRPLPAPRSEWSMGRYVRSLTQWLAEHAPEFDLIFADSLHEEAKAAVDAARRCGIPSVLRFGGSEGLSDAGWWQQSRLRKQYRQACRAADCLVAPRAFAEQELISIGCPRQRIVRIANGFPTAAISTATQRQQARKSLASANSDLHVAADDLVLVTTNRLQPESGIMDLVTALRRLQDECPRLQVWMLNDGELRESIFSHICSEGLQAMVKLPGTFCPIDDLIAAADLYVLPRDTEGLNYFLPRFVAAGVPAAVANTAESRTLMGAAMSHVAAFLPHSPEEIVNAVMSIVNDLPTARENARRARQLVLTHSFNDTVNAYLRVFLRLTGRSDSSSSNNYEPAS